MSREAKTLEWVSDFIREYLSKVETVILQAEAGRNGDMVKLTEKDSDKAIAALKVIEDLCFHMGN